MSYADTIADPKNTGIPGGFQGKLMFDTMGWNGDGHIHRVSRYRSAERATIDRQLELIKLAGGKGVRSTWEGPGNLYIHEATLQMCNACERAGLLFSLIINPQVAAYPNWWLDAGFLNLCNSPAYIPEQYLCDFSTGIDYSKVTLPAGFSVLNNQQGFGWANAYNGDNAGTLAQLQNTNKLPTMKWPFVSLGFNDAGCPTPAGVTASGFTGTRNYGQRVWDATLAPRAIDHQAGNFFFDSVAALALCPAAPYVGMVWNDADEGSGVEHFLATFCNVRIGS